MPNSPVTLSRGRRLFTRCVLVVSLLAVTLSSTTACTVNSSAASPVANTDARSFFSHYLSSDGRIVRTDQGSDTVSEGQAYGMLLAVGIGDRATFDLIWGWTRKHLARADGLLAWRYSNGAVVDATPASDADIDTAVALLHAADVFGATSYRLAGIRIANAVLTYETVTSSTGTVVVAGPWATANPAVVNPSYLVAGTASYLAAKTGNPQWNSVAAATAGLDRTIAATYTLPPDWARLDTASQGATVHAGTSPDGATQPQYGLDAVRLVIRLAASCSATDRALAAAYATRLGSPGKPGARTLDGAAVVTWRNPATDVALWAALSAGGHAAAARTAMRSAQALEKTSPTYYGMAWIALAPLLSGPRLAESCS